MKPIYVIVLLITFCIGCEKEQILPDAITTENLSLKTQTLKGAKKQKAAKITGSVELLWKGGAKGSDKGNKPENLLAFIDLNAHEAAKGKGPKGEIVYRVLETDLSLHREIKAAVISVLVDPDEQRGLIIAQVVSDSKGCMGNGGSGHDSNCSSGEHDDTSHDGGCDHVDGDEGGCDHEDGDEGGCDHEDGDESRCAGGGHVTDKGPGSGGSGEKGNPMSGKNCRLGQILIIKIRDVSTPGTSGDCITWKWFSPDTDFVSDIGTIDDCPHLCKKDIIGGNLVLHY